MSQEHITFKDFVEMQFSNLRDYIDAKFVSFDKATSLAADNINVRLQSMNEFREQMRDQAGQFITRAEHNAMMAKYDAILDTLLQANARQQGMASQKSVTTVTILSVAGIVLSAVALIIHTV